MRLIMAAAVMSWPIDDGWVLLPSPTTPSNSLTSLASSLQRRELEWLLDELHETLQNLKHGLEDCYALLAPVDPGSTLVVSTPRNELVKGHVTRVGTRIVKGVRIGLPSIATIADTNFLLNRHFTYECAQCLPRH